jgi:hypothetical protein
MGKGARGRRRRVRQVEPLHLAFAVREWGCRGAATSSRICGEGEGVSWRYHVEAVEPSASRVWGEGECYYEKGCQRREKRITITYLPSRVWEGAFHSPAFEVRVGIGGEKVIPTRPRLGRG